MKKILCILLSVILCLSLAACGDEEPVSSGGPGRMVRSIQVSIHPADERFDRTYVTQENMNALLTLLRAMETDTPPESDPDLEGQTYYTATVTFANGQQSVYYLVSYTYMRLGGDPWCLVDPDLAMKFNQFLKEHPSDDGSVPTESTAAPTETTSPAE